jgi:CRISPR-associated exonuclease Cas4
MNLESSATYILLAFLLIGAFLVWLGGRRQIRAGLPLGRVVAIDTLHLTGVEEPLYDPVLDLTGRPDYIVRTGRQVIPVEVKSGRARAGPLPGHVLQLAAYCRLVHAQTSRRPPYGILRYADRAFAIDYTETLETELLETLQAMRSFEAQAPPRSHESPSRCRACGVRDACDQRLA